jgi:hypothetical protein
MKRCVFVFGLAAILIGCKAKKPVVNDGSAAVSKQAASAANEPASATPAPVLQPSASTQAKASQITSPGGPKWDWQQYDEETFETKPSEGRVFSVPQNATKLRVNLTASSPVDAAAMTREVFKSAKGVVREDRLVMLPCAVIGVQKEDANCKLDPKTPVVYVVRDRRALTGDPAAIALLRQKAGQQLLGKEVADKVHVTLSVWACVANCGPLGGPAQ